MRDGTLGPMGGPSGIVEVDETYIGASTMTSLPCVVHTTRTWS